MSLPSRVLSPLRKKCSVKQVPNKSKTMDKGIPEFFCFPLALIYFPKFFIGFGQGKDLPKFPGKYSLHPPTSFPCPLPWLWHLLRYSLPMLVVLKCVLIFIVFWSFLESFLGKILAKDLVKHLIGNVANFFRCSVSYLFSTWWPNPENFFKSLRLLKVAQSFCKLW